MAEEDDVWREIGFQGYTPIGDSGEGLFKDMREVEIIKIVADYIRLAGYGAKIRAYRVDGKGGRVRWELEVNGAIVKTGVAVGMDGAIAVADLALKEFVCSQ